MRAVLITAVVLLAAVNALALLPGANALQPNLSGAALARGLIALATILPARGGTAETATPAADAVRPAPGSVPARQADAEVVSFLAMLRARGPLGFPDGRHQRA
jgi:hypothetical protein